MSDVENAGLPPVRWVLETSGLSIGDESAQEAFRAMNAGEVAVVSSVELSYGVQPCEGCPIAPRVDQGLQAMEDRHRNAGRSHMKHSVNSDRQARIAPAVREKREAAATFSACRIACDGFVRRYIEYTTQNPAHVRNAARFAGWLRNWWNSVPETVSFTVVEDACRNDAIPEVAAADVLYNGRPQDHYRRARNGF